jgi:hypothetical protein
MHPIRFLKLIAPLLAVSLLAGGALLVSVGGGGPAQAASPLPRRALLAELASDSGSGFAEQAPTAKPSPSPSPLPLPSPYYAPPSNSMPAQPPVTYMPPSYPAYMY